MANNVFKELEKGNLLGLKRCISLFPASVNAKNSVGATPLHVAAAQGLAPFVKELLVHGAQHDATDGQGNLPLHLAAEQGSLESVTELLTGHGRKVVVKVKNKEGQTPLHIAVRGGHTAVVAKLLDAGARTDAKDKAGATPLELVSAQDEDMLHLLLDSTPTSASGNTSQGLGTSASTRVPDAPHNTQRHSPLGSAAPVNTGSGRIVTPPAPIVTGGSGSRIATATPATPPARNAAAGTPGGSRTPQSGPPVGTPAVPSGMRTSQQAPAGGTPGGPTGRLPRNISIVAGTPASAVTPGGMTGGAGGASAAVLTVNSQLQKHDAALQTLKAGMRAATERLGAMDACASAQLDCAAQVEKALESCGSHSRALSDIEARVGFQEDRSRDVRGRLERLEEGERALQESVSCLTEDSRGLSSQLHKLAAQVAAGNSGAAQHQTAAVDTFSAVSQVQQQLQSELAILRAQMDQLSPALMVATTASAEARTLAARFDAVQQQMQQPHVGGNVLLDQQVLQLQAQVQLLQLPVASLTQQCADLSSRMGGVTEWQQQARADLARLAEAASQGGQAGGNRIGGELSDAVMRVLDTTARTMTELRQQQDETAKQVAALLQQQQQQQPGVAASPPSSSGPPPLPGTPKSASHRVSGTGDGAIGPLGGPPSRNLGGLPSLGSMAREAATQAEVRAELEGLKTLMTDIRKEVASESGSLRREWQRAFSDMQSRYGEQTNELRAREQNIGKLREAALVEEAERRAVCGYEDKFAARLTKLETGVEYLTHRLEVLEEQVSGVVSTLTGAGSPVASLSPGRTAAAMAAARDPSGHPGRPTAVSGPGPVSENHSGFAMPPSHSAAAALSSKAPAHGRFRSAAGPSPAMGAGAMVAQSDGGTALLGAPGGQATRPSRAYGGDAAVAGRTTPTGASAMQEHEQWWWAAIAQPAWPGQSQGTDVTAASAAGLSLLPGTGASTGAAFGPIGVEIQTAAGSCSAGIAMASMGIGAEGQRPAPGFLPSRSVMVPAPEGGSVAGGSDRTAMQPQHWPFEATAAGAPHHETACPGAGFACSPLLHGPSATTGLPKGVMYEHGGHSGTAFPDPASMGLGPQLVPAAAQAMLAPSVDIQRLAAAAAARQQQNQRFLAQPHQYTTQSFCLQQQQQGLSLLGPSVGAADSIGRDVPSSSGGVEGAGSSAAASAGGASQALLRGSSRKEPPMCLFCPMQ